MSLKLFIDSWLSSNRISRQAILFSFAIHVSWTTLLSSQHRYIFHLFPTDSSALLKALLDSLTSSTCSPLDVFYHHISSNAFQSFFNLPP
ncbi:hypothetical protein K491DRAFT_140339 [Lophiostoma macrostomum CBS 122681]|uniref:Uncharacterized protein n=1 Tax=Lophiostoma macrostomum CBS 122681 TaxID=1314788 RepID=A0A6A6SS30_9PLEO|nr:hypothetical protein K491DRAFT_140339 [Lophiostoma macrostomum CBS 122681]